jgi:lycopene beta-cyclase
VNAPLVIVGGGLAGGLAALALSERRPDVDFLLLESGASFGGRHIWSWFDGDVAAEHEWVLGRLSPRRWLGHEVRFPKRLRSLAGGYNSLSSEAFDAALTARLRPDRYRLGVAVAEIAPDKVRLATGETIAASAVIDARGPQGIGAERLGWQKFLGVTARFAKPHGLARPIVMDARVDQSFGYRFVYALPFAPDEALIEDTYYSSTASVDAPRLRRQVADYARSAGWGELEPMREEIGILPIPLDDRFEGWWQAGPPVPRIGLRGGFFHPTTGYSLPQAVGVAAWIAGQRDLSAIALHGQLRARAERHWQSGAFYRRLNRMLFEAAAPPIRYRVLEHFYRLPEPVIARFYAGRTSALDKLRILSGRPPVPVRRALAAARSR